LKYYDFGAQKLADFSAGDYLLSHPIAANKSLFIMRLRQPIRAVWVAARAISKPPTKFAA
jgi:hypothetical protein